MTKKSSTDRVQRKRERDRAAGLVRVEEIVPAQSVDQIHKLAKRIREMTEFQVGALGDITEGVHIWDRDISEDEPPDYDRYPSGHQPVVVIGAESGTLLLETREEVDAYIANVIAIRDKAFPEGDG